jgi:VWFA-related protein
MLTRLLLAALAATIAAPLAAQITFRSRVDTVRVDALVTVDGQPVRGLTADDFQLRDEGVPQQVRLVGAGTFPVNVVLALDMSASLDAARLARLRMGGAALVRALGDEDRAAIVGFNHVVGLEQPPTSDRQVLHDALSVLVPTGMTSLVDAMYSGLLLADSAEHRSLLIVFSDGLDTASWLSADTVVRTARRLETVVYAVATTRSDVPALLDHVASATGGQVLRVDSGKLDETFVEILAEFRERYLLAYTLPAGAAPGWHRIEVRVKRRGATVRARPGYFVGSGEADPSRPPSR